MDYFRWPRYLDGRDACLPLADCDFNLASFWVPWLTQSGGPLQRSHR
jgi:hypothetical protein